MTTPKGVKRIKLNDRLDNINRREAAAGCQAGRVGDDELDKDG